MPRQPQNKAWDDFVSWCQRRGLAAVPANPWTLAAYVRWCETRQSSRAIAKAVREISTVHETKTRRRLDRDPLVQRTLDMIEKRRLASKEKSRLDLFDGPDTSKPAKKRAPRSKSKTPPAKTPSGARQSLSPTPRLVSRRRLSR